MCIFLSSNRQFATMSVTVFIDIEANEQVEDIKGYLRSKGANIPDETTSLEVALAQVIDASEFMWKEGINEGEIETVFNSIISLVMVLPLQKSETLTHALCDKLEKAQPGDKKNTIRLRLLNNLFHGLEENSPLRYVVYTSLIRLAGQCGLLQVVNPKLEEVKNWISLWNVGTAKVQVLLRVLHEAFTECKQSEQATKMMLELLGTYTEENASQAREDAHKCIVTCLADPNTLLLDHLLALKPVKFLEGELIHDLLTIFVTGKIKQYMQFYESNKDFISSLGLSHDENVHKMRLVTFMQIAEGKSEISFETIKQELQLPANDIEAFIIAVVRTSAVKVKIDQMSERVLIGTTTHRTFGKQQWQQLYEQLGAWQQNTSLVLSSLQTVTPR